LVAGVESSFIFLLFLFLTLFLFLLLYPTLLPFFFFLLEEGRWGGVGGFISVFFWKETVGTGVRFAWGMGRGGFV
jgi:hypothetical protein